MKAFSLLVIILLALSGCAKTAYQPPVGVDHSYIGIIKNTTKYDVSIPSANSGGTLVVPARGWIEYTVWAPSFEFTSYVEGKPFYCNKVTVNPKGYPFMCKAYDFMAIIAKDDPEPKAKAAPRKKRRKPVPKGPEVEGLG